jgi:hypothetical protein
LWIADLDAGYAEAEPLADEVRSWLLSSRLVPAQRARVVAARRTGHRAPTPPGPPAGHPGVEIAVGRTVFCCATYETVIYGPLGRRVLHRQSERGEQVNCPHCGNGRAATEVLSVADRWLAGGRGGCECRYCERVVELNRWLWSVPRAFAHLGLRFWNWPPLDEDFLAGLDRHLGHRTMIGILS